MRKSRREERALARDEELLVLEDFEQGLEEDVRYLWRRTREMAGHEAWNFYEGFPEDTWCGCDCNHWNRVALRRAIHRLRVWRERREFCV